MYFNITETTEIRVEFPYGITNTTYPNNLGAVVPYGRSFMKWDNPSNMPGLPKLRCKDAHIDTEASNAEKVFILLCRHTTEMVKKVDRNRAAAGLPLDPTVLPMLLAKAEKYRPKSMELLVV